MMSNSLYITAMEPGSGKSVVALGMAVLSAIIAVPLRYSARGVTWLHSGIQATVGLATIVIGARLIYLNSLAPAA